MSDPQRSKTPMIIALAGAAVVVAAVAAFALTRSGSGGTAESTTVVASATAEDPAANRPIVIGRGETIAGFITDSAGTALAPVPSHLPTGRVVTGDQPEIYVGVAQQIACDKSQLLAGIEGSANSSTWLNQIGTTDSVADYLDETTPVNLRWNTLVTIGYPADAEAEAKQEPAVLRAGTAVLIDETGVPVVRCASGSPLKGVDSTAPKSVTVEAAAEDVKAFTLITSDLSGSFERPAGTDGTEDSSPVQVPAPPVTTPSPSATGVSQAPDDGETER